MPERPAGGEQHPAPPLPQLAGADALRALAAVAVVVIHVSYWPHQDAGADRAVYRAILLLARVSVPAFVLLAGLVLGYRHGARPAGAAFAWRRARRTLLPWLVWAPLFCVADLAWSGQLRPTAGAVASWWASGGGHLYFLLLVPQLYVLFLAWPSGVRSAWGLAAAAVAVQLALDTVRLMAPVDGAAHQLLLVRGYILFPFWIGYFATGVAGGRWLASRRGRGMPAWPFALAAVPAAAALLLVNAETATNGRYARGTGAFLIPLMLPLVLAACAALILGAPRLLARGRRLSRITDVISRHSLGIYIIHPLVLTAVGRLLLRPLRMHLPGSLLPFIALVAASLGGGLLASMALARTPLAFTIGESRPREVNLTGHAATTRRAA